jgi:hypothetical protein
LYELRARRLQEALEDQSDGVPLVCVRRRPPYAQIETAKLNDVDPQAWLADVLGRIADHKVNR